MEESQYAGLCWVSTPYSMFLRSFLNAGLHQTITTTPSPVFFHSTSTTPHYTYIFLSLNPMPNHRLLNASELSTTLILLSAIARLAQTGSSLM